MNRRALKITAHDCVELGVSMKIVEPLGGAHRHIDRTIEGVGQARKHYLNCGTWWHARKTGINGFANWGAWTRRHSGIDPEVVHLALWTKSMSP